MTTTSDHSDATAATTDLTTRNRVGVVLAVILGLIDIASLAALGATPAPGEEGPPDAVLAFGAVLGLVSLVTAVLGWRRRSRGMLRIAAAARLLNTILSLPAFFVEGVPSVLVAVSAVGVIVSLVTIALLVSRR